MLELNTKELVFCAKSYSAHFYNELKEAIKVRLRDYPEEAQRPGLLELTPLALAKLLALPSDLIELLANPHLQQAEKKDPPNTKQEETLFKKYKEYTKIKSPVPKINQLPIYKTISSFQIEAEKIDEKLIEQLSALNIEQSSQNIKLEQKSTLDALDVMLRAIHSNRLQRLIEFLQEGYATEFETFLKCKIGHYSFNLGIDNIFCYMVVEHEDLTFQDSLAGSLQVDDKMTTTQMCMLIRAHNRILELIHWPIQDKVAQKIEGYSHLFNDLIAKDLPHQAFIPTLEPTVLQNIAQSNNLPLRLVQNLFQISLCVNPSSNDFQEVSHAILGLSGYYCCHEIIAALLKIQECFNQFQKLIAYFILKELIINSPHLSLLELKVISSLYIPALFKDQNSKYVSILRALITLRASQNQHLVNNYFHLAYLIECHLAKKAQISIEDLFKVSKKSTTQQAESIANELRAYCLMLYHNLSIKELMSFNWKNSEGLLRTPSVYAITQYFNHFNNWLTQYILQIEDLKQRARLIKLLIKVAHRLIENEVPDFNSAMVIFATLNQAPICRLKETFTLLDKKTQHLFNELEIALSPQGNYKNIRLRLAKSPYALPYFGLITSDLIFAQENSENNAFVITGKVMEGVIKMKQTLANLHLPLSSSIAQVIPRWVCISDKELFELSLIREPRLVQSKDEPTLLTQFHQYRTSNPTGDQQITAQSTKAIRSSLT